MAANEQVALAAAAERGRRGSILQREITAFVMSKSLLTKLKKNKKN
jgi:hypothetical protein